MSNELNYKIPGLGQVTIAIHRIYDCYGYVITRRPSSHHKRIIIPSRCVYQTEELAQDAAIEFIDNLKNELGYDQ